MRQLAVSEWLENSAFNQEFMMDIDIKLEAPKLLSSGFYHSDLADTMVLSLANTLEVTIIVFSYLLSAIPFLCNSSETDDFCAYHDCFYTVW